MSQLAIHDGPAVAADLEVPPWPQSTPQSEENVLEAVRSGAWGRLAREESWVDRFEDRFADLHEADHAVAVANGTVAIQLALRACGVRPGDEVLVPANTFIATASAVACTGAVPRFVDVDPQTYNLDPNDLEARVTDRTVGVVGVHFAGYPMDLDAVAEVTTDRGLFLIEDASHAQGTAWRGERVGTAGAMGTFSFQNSKSISGGEGGVVVTDDPLLAEEAELIQNIGRVPGEPGYKHYIQSSNYRMSELHGALLCAQIEAFPEAFERRRRGGARLREELDGIPGIALKPEDDRMTERGYYFFNFTFDPERFGGVSRDRLVTALRAEGVPAHGGYELPLYRQPAFAREEIERLVPDDAEVPMYRHRSLPGAESVCSQMVCLSHEVLLADPEDLALIAAAVEKVQANAGAL